MSAAQEALDALLFSPPEVVERLLEQLRDRRRREAEELAASKPARLKLFIHELSTLYLLLHKHIQGEAYLRLQSNPVAGPGVNVRKLLAYIEDSLIDYPATGPAARPIGLRFHGNEARFIREALANRKCDEWRKAQLRNRLFVPLDELRGGGENADENGGPAPAFDPPGSDNPETAITQAEIRKALSELPPELASAAEALPLVGGNVSALARRLGQPQRKTARQVERIRKHLRSCGLEP